MIFVIVPTIAFLSFLLGRYIFKRWFNHISLFAFIWMGMIMLYELRLLPYKEIVSETWLFIASTFISFILGTLTYVTLKRLFPSQNPKSEEGNREFNKIFADDAKVVRYSLFLFSFISIAGAVQHWMVLIDMFGSIPKVFLNALTIYRMNTEEGGIKGQVPFVSNFGYVAVFWGAVYTAYKGKFTFLSILPFIGIIIKETSTIGRAGILLGLFEFIFVFLLFRHCLTINDKEKFRFSRPNATISITFLLALLIFAASVVKISRVSFEQYQGASKTLRELEGNFILSPSVYLYLSAHIGVLNEFVKRQDERTLCAQNTLLPVYNFLARLDIVKRPNQYQKGYFIPMWVNTGTFIRELFADFNVFGLLLFPYLLGLFMTYLWFRLVREGSLYILVILSYLYIIIGFSFLVMITRTSYWSISLSLNLLTIFVIAQIVKRKQRNKTEVSLGTIRS
jgi:oligosaccharide repeat unit polymerase